METDYDTCIKSANKILKLEPNEQNVRVIGFQYLCKCYTAASEATSAITNCQEALKIERDANTLCDSAEAYLAADMFDDGNLVLYIHIRF